MAEWLEKLDIRLNSVSVEIEVEVEAELGNKKLLSLIDLISEQEHLQPH